MIIKKFTAQTEQEAILKAKEEMGSSAVVLNVKTIKQRGIMRLFKKDSVEITAALEEKTTSKIPVSTINAVVDDNASVNNNVNTNSTNSDENDLLQKAAIEEKLDNLQNMLKLKMEESVSAKDDEMDSEVENAMEKIKAEKDDNFTFVQLVYNKLIDSEVDERYVNQIISEIESSLKKENTLDGIITSVYQKIVLKLGSPNTLDDVENDKEKDKEKETKLVFFVGPTGVGKTTTIAKIASRYKLDKNKKVAFITSDTYRIAAVEQLRTYATILDIPITVAYTLEELNNSIEEYKDYDMILVDTAGRSHKNKEHCEEMIHMVKDCVVPDGVTKSIYLVLSVATKYRDLLNIMNVYGEIGDFSLIFTKLDETSALGNILNIKFKTGATLSYVSTGQTVPDDISIIDPQKLAKNLLGGGE